MTSIPVQERRPRSTKLQQVAPDDKNQGEKR
jgi:hypothetical protein